MIKIKIVLVFCFCSLVAVCQDKIQSQIPETTIRQDSLTINLSELEIDDGKVDAIDFNRGLNFSVLDLVQGRKSQFIYNNINPDDPNPSYSYQIRGVSSLTSDIGPLLIMDGVPIRNYDFIMSENIKSIGIHPDMCSGIDVGFTTESGLMEIKSKQNSNTNLVVNYNFYTYIESFKEKYYLNADQFRERNAYWKLFASHGVMTDLDYTYDYGYDTDWLEVLSQNKFNHSHNLAMGKKIKNTSFNLMLTYKDLNGIIKKIDNNIFNGHLVMGQTLLKEKLKIKAIFIANNRNYSQINYNPAILQGDYTNYRNIISYAENTNPTLLSIDKYGNYPYDTIIVNNYKQNPLEQLNNTIDDRKSSTYLSIVDMDCEINKFLTFTTIGSYLKGDQNQLFESKSRVVSNDIYVNRLIKISSGFASSFLKSNLKYQRSIKKNRIGLELSYILELNNSTEEIYDSATQIGGSYKFIKSALIDKLRWDKFNFNLKYKYSNLFLFNSGITKSFVNNKNTIKDTLSLIYHFQSVLSLNNLMRMPSFLKSLNAIVSYSTFQNTKLASYQFIQDFEPARLYDIDYGIESSLFNDKFNFSIIHYFKKISNLWQLIWLPPSTGYQIKFENIDIKNTGYGADFKINLRFNKLKIKTNINFTTNHSFKISKSDLLKDNPKDVPIGNFNGYYFVGFNDTIDVRMFEPLYMAENGGTTNQTSNAKIGVIGNGMPKYNIGLFSMINYENFEVSFLIKSAFGFEIWNMEHYYDEGSNKILKYMTYHIPSDYYFSLKKNTDYGMLDGSYTKIDNITLKYNIPCKNLKINSLGIYFSVNNPFVFSHNYGIDPEMLSISGVSPGTLFYKNYPETIIYQLGFDIKL